MLVALEFFCGVLGRNGRPPPNTATCTAHAFKLAVPMHVLIGHDSYCIALKLLLAIHKYVSMFYKLSIHIYVCIYDIL